MDLSSLEGPPIHDPRFTIAPSHPNLPRIHLEYPVSSQNHTERRLQQILPTRPASADTIPFQYGRFRNRDHLTPRQSSSSRRSLSTISLRSTRRSSLSNRSPGSDFLHGRAQNDYRRSQHGDSSSLDIPPNPHLLPQPQPQRTMGELVWLENENMWVVSEPLSLPLSSGPPNSYPPAQQRSPTLAMPTIEPQPWMDETLDDDLPPSYESHYFDRVLTVQPRETEPEPEMPVQDAPVIGTATTQPDTSRWTAVARRVASG
ncbi:hypothetical protein PHISCL_01250 [Aspergillus sclerotialis]|uniref:Uncharacterized protein n=1 Tax=Aspergillus sclerotialis TaxID=2070753 RepID=A0A3A2ZTG8_9EURO|nr:hypothetical protein PHISCL_01250 [Aspergillus sclerotialis]